MNALAQALNAALNYAIVSHEVIQHHETIGFLYREAPVFEHDSGWRFFSGMESDEYVSQPENFVTLPLSEVVAQYPEIRELMSHSAGAWEWDEEQQQYIAVADWSPKD